MTDLYGYSYFLYTWGFSACQECKGEFIEVKPCTSYSNRQCIRKSQFVFTTKRFLSMCQVCELVEIKLSETDGTY